ncbi:unnamed protein product, partial [Ectocarpus sp. 8 AP-2014]
GWQHKRTKSISQHKHQEWNRVNVVRRSPIRPFSRLHSTKNSPLLFMSHATTIFSYPHPINTLVTPSAKRKPSSWHLNTPCHMLVWAIASCSCFPGSCSRAHRHG